MRSRNTFLSICAALCVQSSLAAYQDAIRHSELANELTLRGLAQPTGSGVRVTQVEVPEATNAYLPERTNTEFSGKTITDRSTDGLSSGHATTVAKNLYGNTTSIAPGITEVDAYEANDWLDRGWYSATPPLETNPLQNHSWVAWSEDNNASIRMDYAMNRDRFLAIAGLYNADWGPQDTPSDIPDTYASIYNGITVGVSDGSHRQGTTSYDGVGRTKPEIVAPASFTSYATPYVTAAAAILIESAGAHATASDPLVLKATLLAGADKSPFSDWDQTTGRPIDEVYGAGQLDVYENYFIQQAGQQAADTAIAPRGWNLSNVSSSNSERYDINVPAGFELRNFSALITWNREVSRRLNRYTASLADLSLSLDGETVSQSSDSAVDNIEHIWRDSNHALASGNYTLTVASTNSSSTTYALAWRSELYQDYNLWSATTFTDETPLELRDRSDDPDQDGIPNLHEQAFGGNPQTSDPHILPVCETALHNGQRYLQISYRKPTFNNALTYSVETVVDLNGTWSSHSSAVERISISAESGNYDRYTYRCVEPISSNAKAFLRVTVSE